MIVAHTEIPEILRGGDAVEAWQPQLRLFHVVDEDDLVLARSPEATWFEVLHGFDWRPYRQLAADYYGALYHFNLNAAQRSTERAEETTRDEAPETKDEARQRLLFDRPTVEGSETPILFEPTVRTYRPVIAPNDIAPGRPPIREAGRQPKCFFSMFKAFLGVTLIGRAPEPETVHQELVNNPSFARACGFTPLVKDSDYRPSDVPSLRKLEQFDQIMTEYGLWEKCKWNEIRTNIALAIIDPEPIIVHDTSHWPAWSSFEVVAYEDIMGKAQKKSQSKPTKLCGCVDKDACHHPWILNDDGAGTVVKSSGRYWAHKGSLIALPRQGILLDAVALTDAATHDSKTLIPHLRRLFAKLPEIQPWFKFVLDDSAAYDDSLFEQVFDEFDLNLRASVNPRRRKPIVEDLPRGMAKLTPYGELICHKGHAMDYRGIRWQTERFIYGPPLDDQGLPYCSTCDFAQTCCPNAESGRHVTISFDLLPHIRVGDPPMAKKFKAMMTLRPAIERVIKFIKFDLASKHLTKRGNASFQARLDKSFIALHILLRL